MLQIVSHLWNSAYYFIETYTKGEKRPKSVQLESTFKELASPAISKSSYVGSWTNTPC